MKSSKCLTILSFCIMLHDWMIAWHMMLWLCIQLTWRRHVNYLALDIWHRCLICHHLSPDTWHLIPDTWYLAQDNWHAITWYLTYAITCYWYTWHDAVTPDWILSHLTPALYLWGLDIIIILQLDIWYSWAPILLNSCTPELLYS